MSEEALYVEPELGSLVDGIWYGDPLTYNDGTTAQALRSGVDGPHAGLADRLCNINGRLYG